ncbi:site-specific DNA recombinase [Inquilinus ginsengisoli]|uniref:recombinase family protein n=1 Tax=Inquilinus ginsengisoli TaxID=363840 RepID=UPI003D25C5BB
MESDWKRAGRAPPANDNAGQAGRIDPRLLVIARAIGRHIARELLRPEAVNDNRPEAADQGREENDPGCPLRPLFRRHTYQDPAISGAIRGRVEKGRSGSGLCYGYDVVKRTDAEGDPLRGERRINEAEAPVVPRIFREFAAGRSPHAIATGLNADGIPGPLGREWADTTIRGHASRGTGILNNELYAGVLVWNRLHFVKDPATGRRVSRPNPEAKWIRNEVPALRIVDDELWQAVKARQTVLAKQFEATTIAVRKARAKTMHSLRRPAFLLSGLLICGCCGGKYGIMAAGRYGCLAHFRRGRCDNSRTITREKIEKRVLAGLTETLVSPEAVAEAVRSCVERTNHENHERRARGEADRAALVRIERGIRGIMQAIEDGMYQPSMKARMDELERQKAEIETRLSEAPADIPDVHPNVAEIYRRKVRQLTETLVHPETRDEAAEAIRSLVGQVVLTPGEGRGMVKARLSGELMAILDFAAGRRPAPRPEVITTAVAGPRFEPARATVKSRA